MGLGLSSFAITPGQHQWLEILVGFGIAGTGFGVILAVVGRAASDKNRSLTLGIVTAAGSAGQIVGPPIVAFLLAAVSWQTTFIFLAGAVSIALIGLFNIGGTLLAGWLGNQYSRKYLLAIIYMLRTIVAALFILNPITPESVILFSISMGALWLATVPLTSGLVAEIYGLRYMGTLYGIVFFSHQLGGFLGVWLGGVMYDIYNNYTLVWWIGVGFGALSAFIHLPVKEMPWQKRAELQAA